MSDPAPGDRRPARLERPPSDRYVPSVPPGGASPSAPGGPAPRRPVLLAVLAAAVTAALLALLGGVLASSAGLLFVAGVGSAATGLALAGASVPDAAGAARLTRAAAVRWSVALALGAVVVGALLTWAISRSQGGALGPVELLWETFGLLVPAELVVAAAAGAWGAEHGPVRGD